VLPITVFQMARCTLKASLFGSFDPKVVAMLAEIFMVRCEAKARLMGEVLPSSTSHFIPFSPRNPSVFKQPDLKGQEPPSKEPHIEAVR
jgi:hypothetical protein